MGIQQIVPAQRKDEDAAFAAARGIRVPKVFASFDEARDFVLHQGGKIIIRSEHPLEREGLSGINMSFTLDLKGLEPTAWNAYLFQNFAQITAEELDRRLQRFHREYINSSMYCKENGIDLAEYVAQLRYSYWEYIHGYNLYIAADPVIANRYRVFARWFEMVQRGIGGEFRPLMRLSYDIFDGVNKISDDRTPPAILDRMQDILHLYNEVRSLFGQQMCWIEEIQLGANGALYFLQRSVGQLFKPCAWSFDGDEACDLLIGHTYDYGEVRGTTPKEGIKVDFVLDEGIRARRLKSYSHTALLDAHIDSSVCEQQRLLSIPAYIQTSPPHHGSGICDPHSAILPIVRCPLFLSAPKMHKKFPADILDRIRTVSRAKRGDDPQWYMNHKKMARIKLHIRSDGNEARVRVVNIY